MTDPLHIDAEEYLDRYGVTAYMKDVVTLLLENRPDDPTAFMLKYFRTVTQGSSPLLRAYRYIRLAPPSQDAFIDNLVSAYVALDAKRGVSGVNGSELLRLLRLLTAECRLDVSRSLLLLLGLSEADPVSFEAFSASVRAALQYDDFLRRASELFATFDARGTGQVPSSVLQLAVRQVRGSTDAAAIATALAAANSGESVDLSASLSTLPLSVAARAELHRLQREVQCEIAELGEELEPLGSTASPSASTRATVGRDEFLKALFAASIAGQPASAAAADVAKVQQPQPSSVMSGIGAGTCRPASASSAEGAGGAHGGAPNPFAQVSSAALRKRAGGR